MGATGASGVFTLGSSSGGGSAYLGNALVQVDGAGQLTIFTPWGMSSIASPVGGTSTYTNAIFSTYHVLPYNSSGQMLEGINYSISGMDFNLLGGFQFNSGEAYYFNLFAL